MKKPKLRELKEAIRALVRGPYTTRFPAEVRPVPDTFRGQAEFHEKDCIGCKACAEVCPADAITVVDLPEADPPVRRLEIMIDRCIWCGHCEANCTTKKGVMLGQKYDRSTLDRSELRERVEKELVLCEGCGKVIGCRDHLKWIADRIGAKSYANPTLFLVAEQSLAGSYPRVGGGPGRADIIRILCTECRRSTLTREVWG